LDGTVVQLWRAAPLCTGERRRGVVPRCLRNARKPDAGDHPGPGHRETRGDRARRLACEAFPDPADYAAAKIAIFLASLIAGVVGAVILWPRNTEDRRPQSAEEAPLS